MREDFIFIPPEFTYVDGVMEAMRKSMNVRNAVMRMKPNPKDKIA